MCELTLSRVQQHVLSGVRDAGKSLREFEEENNLPKNSLSDFSRGLRQPDNYMLSLFGIRETWIIYPYVTGRGITRNLEDPVDMVGDWKPTTEFEVCKVIRRHLSDERLTQIGLARRLGLKANISQQLTGTVRLTAYMGRLVGARKAFVTTRT